MFVRLIAADKPYIEGVL